MPRTVSRLVRFTVAIGATVLATALRVAFMPLWGYHLPFITFFPAIVLSAWLGGFAPGLLATGLSAVAATILWRPVLETQTFGAAAGGIAFLGFGTLISALVSMLHRTREIREEAEGAAARLAAIVQSSDDAIVSKTLDGVITSWNAAATRMFGYAPEEVIGRSITIIIPEDRREEEIRVLAAIRRGESIEHFETIRVRKDGTSIPISLTVSPVRNAAGEIIGVSKIARDISARREMERERAALLARERSARREAEAASRAKDEFLAMLGHELRNPLAAISNAIYVLERSGMPEEAAATARSVAARQIRHLTRLVDDLFDVGRVLSGKVTLDLKALDLSDLVERTIDTIRESGQSEHHALSFEGIASWVKADGTRVEQITTNLVTNALKFTPPGGTVTVQVAQDGGVAVLRVSDNGIGIAPGLLPDIFDLFVQGQAPLDRRQGGLGIGLTLVRRLTEQHGGSVAAESEGPGRGTIVTVRLPLIDSSSITAAVGPASHCHDPRRILIVEDNDDAREMLRAMLELWHHEVREAPDGVRGVEVAREFQPDVALIDVGLPGIDGYEVARRLRSSSASKTIRLIALTGYGSAKDAERAREAGFDARIVKPLNPDRLAAMLGSKSRDRDA
jgi:PAS domain S-box-containing protein